MLTLLATIALLRGDALATPQDCRLAADYSASCGGYSVLMMRNGKVEFEEHANGSTPSTPHELASGTKSFWGVVAMAAVEDGILKLDERVSGTITEWKGDARKSQITVWQLLHLCSGLTGGTMGWPPPYSEAIDTPTFAEPGKQFRYGPAPYQVFGEFLKRKLDGESPLSYLERRIFKPVGIQHGRWLKDRDGNPHLPSGAALTAREWAKFGEFVRLQGKWEGKQVLAKDLLAKCFVSEPANPNYGLTWWLPPRRGRGSLGARLFNAHVSDVLSMEGLPSDTVLAAGAGGQRMYVIPSQGLVIVRQAPATRGDKSGFSDTAFLSRLLWGKTEAPPSKGGASEDAGY